MFQSPERIHAFGNYIIANRIAIGYSVSIPREDSCFWELHRKHIVVTPAAVSIPREDSCFWERLSVSCVIGSILFQSPERIHAFGNWRCVVRSRSVRVSIPREDSCFWEHINLSSPEFQPFMFQSPERIHAFGNRICGSSGMKSTSFNPQRGFMLLGTLDECPPKLHRQCFNPQRGFMLLGTCRQN